MFALNIGSYMNDMPNYIDGFISYMNADSIINIVLYTAVCCVSDDFTGNMINQKKNFKRNERIALKYNTQITIWSTQMYAHFLSSNYWYQADKNMTFKSQLAVALCVRLLL